MADTFSWERFCVHLHGGCVVLTSELLQALPGVIPPPSAHGPCAEKQLPTKEGGTKPQPPAICYVLCPDFQILQALVLFPGRELDGQQGEDGVMQTRDTTHPMGRASLEPGLHHKYILFFLLIMMQSLAFIFRWTMDLCVTLERFGFFALVGEVSHLVLTEQA